MPANSILDTEVTLSFTASEISQLEAFASLHGVSLFAFVRGVALDAAQVTSTPAKKDRTPEPGALWMTEVFVDTAEPQELKPVDAIDEPETNEEPGNVAPPVVKRGVTGEPSKFARGTGPVWDIRQALGRERVHGLGWTREQMAFVLKLSVVGVRKMEHLGTSPIKSLEARRKLLELSKLLEHPTPEICAYIKAEEKALG
jgi:hypothetical protein